MRHKEEVGFLSLGMLFAAAWAASVRHDGANHEPNHYSGIDFEALTNRQFSSAVRSVIGD